MEKERIYILARFPSYLSQNPAFREAIEELHGDVDVVERVTLSRGKKLVEEIREIVDKDDGFVYVATSSMLQYLYERSRGLPFGVLRKKIEGGKDNFFVFWINRPIKGISRVWAR
ncbi:MAG TPA: hypothetical protein EYP30_04670 [Archaeoglobaceae archaeon]|nr:hypothetical protein [Archaeoglobaceae archaeon]